VKGERQKRHATDPDKPLMINLTLGHPNAGVLNQKTGEGMKRRTRLTPNGRVCNRSGGEYSGIAKQEYFRPFSKRISEMTRRGWG